MSDLSLPYINNYSMEMEAWYVGHSSLLQKIRGELYKKYKRGESDWEVLTGVASHAMKNTLLESTQNTGFIPTLHAIYLFIFILN